MIIYDKDGVALLIIEVDDTSVRYKAINGENSLTLKFSLPEHVEVPVGAYCVFKGETYVLMMPEDLTMNHRRSFEYSLVMYSEDAKAKRYMFINPVDGRLKFSLTAKPIEHLQMFVDNMNKREGVNDWKVGECVDHVEIVLSYNHTYCYDALVQLANELELDYWFEGKTVNLGKLEVNKDEPLPLSYGGDGLGLKPNIKRTNYGDALPMEILYVQGTSANIDPSKYRVPDGSAMGSSTLLLPSSKIIGYDGVRFEDEDGFDDSKARYYITDSEGYSVRRADKAILNHSEDSLDCSEIEPTKAETVENVVVSDKEKHFYDLVFKSDVDYKQYVIDGENATIVFQSGMLAGKEFDLATDKNGNLICVNEAGGYWRVEIVPQEIDGITMPDEASGYLPVKGDTFKVFGIQLPNEYVLDAEMEMLRYAVKHLYANEDAQYTISGELDEIYAKRHWDIIGNKIVLGGYVSFSDKSFQEEPLLIRITGIKEYVNKPYSPTLEISNSAIAGSLIGAINRIENQEAETEDKFKRNRQYTKRRFSSIKETLSLLQGAFDDFAPGIDPVTVETMTLVAGDPRSQFRFTKSVNSLDSAPCPFYYDAESKMMKTDAGALVHFTLNVDSVTAPNVRNAGDYLSWVLDAGESEVLLDGDVPYYVCVEAPKDGSNAKLFVTPTPIDLEVGENYYFYVGILNSESGGARDFATIYGFTEVAPGRIVTNVIRSADGKTYFDLENNTIGGNIKFVASDGKEKSMSDYADEQNVIIQNVQDQIDGVVENYYLEGAPTIDNYPAIEWDTDVEKLNHIGDVYINIATEEQDPDNAGKAWRWCICGEEENLGRYDEIVVPSGTIVANQDTLVGKLNTSYAYINVQLNNKTSKAFVYGQYIDVYAPVKVRIDTDGSVYIYDPYGRYASDTFTLKFYRSEALRAIDKDGNEVFLHWHPIVDAEELEKLHEAYKARSEVDELKYLKGTFARGTTEIAGGVVLTEMIAVKDENNEIQAFMNGSDVGQDTEHGKLLIAAGIEDITKPEEAKTRIYEDGTIETKKLHLDNGCTIGSKMAVREGALVINDDQYLLSLSSAGIINRTERTYASIGNCGTAAVQGFGYDGGFCVSTTKGIGVQGEANNGEYAFYSNCGVFAGLRTMTRVISTPKSSSDPNVLTNIDFNILVNATSGTYYIKLPDSPLDGQEYHITTKGAYITLLSNAYNMYSLKENNPSLKNSFNTTLRGVFRMKYYKNASQWIFNWIDSY